MTLVTIAAQLREMATAIEALLGQSSSVVVSRRQSKRGPYKKHARQPHWTQTPAGKRKLAKAIRAAHAARKRNKPNGADHDTQPTSAAE